MREGTAQDPNHTTTSVTDGVGGVIAWACMAAEDTGSLIFIDDITADGSSKIHSEVYRHIISAQGQANASKPIGQWIILHQDNDPKHTAKATKEFFKAKKW